MITCTRRLQFCSGHRVAHHESKCARLHGHNYVLLATASADQLDSIGRVIDFSEIKRRLGSWIEEQWDHKMLIWEFDPILRILPPTFAEMVQVVPFNPTAEEMARYLVDHVCPALFEETESGIVVPEVVLWETENCFATARRKQ